MKGTKDNLEHNPELQRHEGDDRDAYDMLGRPPKPAEPPTDPAALRANLIAAYRARVVRATEGEVRDYVVDYARMVLVEAEISPQLRSALVRLIARTPGAQPVAGAKDPRGRTGQSVRIARATPTGGRSAQVPPPATHRTNHVHADSWPRRTARRGSRRAALAAPSDWSWE